MSVFKKLLLRFLFIFTVTIDGKATSSKKGKTLPLPKKGKEAPEEISSDETSEDEESDPTYEESTEADDSQSDGRSDVETDQSEDEVDAEVKPLNPSEAMKKTKAKLVKKPKEDKKKTSKRKASKRKGEKEVRPSKKQKVENDVQAEEKKDEKSFTAEPADPNASAVDDSSKPSKTTKKEMAQFSDKNVDYDLFHNSATNVIPRRIKISNNLVVTCRMVEQFESKNITNDYPAITFQRKTAGEKCFEFILPLNLSPKIVEAVNLIIKDNSRFFTSA